MGNKKPTFEEALAQLEAIGERIEQGKIGLEESIVQYEQGMKLVRQCQDILGKAEMRIQQLQQKADGALEAKTFSRKSNDDKQD